MCELVLFCSALLLKKTAAAADKKQAMDSSSSSSSGRKASSSGGGGGVVCKKRTPPTTKKTFRYSYFIFAETQLCDSCTGKKPKHCPPSLKGWTVTAAIAKKSSKKKRRKNSTPASSSASSSSSSSWPPSTSSAAAGEDRQLGMFRGGARRAARFDWEIEGPPRALGHSSTRSPWLLLHCMWWEYNIAIEEEASLLGTRGRGRWKSCWSAQAFQDAWTELSAELDTAVDIPSTAAGEDRAFRTLLTWGVTTGVFKPPFQHRFQGSNFKWLANAFEDYQDFCFGKRLLWGLDMVPR